MAVELYNEHEQSERVKKWIKDNGMSVVFAVILALAGIFGWRQWVSFQDTQQQAAAERYGLLEMAVDAEDMEEAEDHFAILQDQHDRHMYTTMATMLFAALRVEEERLEEAAELYRSVLESRRAADIHPIARLRLSRVLLAMDNPDEALAVLDEQEAPTGFRAAWSEVRGDILLARNQREEARAAYQLALDEMSAQGGNPQLVRLKLDHAGGPLNGDGSDS